MKFLTKSLFALLCCVPFVCAAEARADTLVLTSGYVQIGSPTGFVTPGSRGQVRSIYHDAAGSNVSIRGNGADGQVQQILSPCVFGACAPGTVISGSSNANLLQNQVGSADINGVLISPTAYLGQTVFHFRTGDLVVPTSTASSLTLTTSFTMTGNLVVFGRDATNTTWVQIFSTTVSGEGVATIYLQRFQDGYFISSIRYDFGASAVPEPATLVLLGTSLASGAALRRRRRGRTR